MAQTKIAGLFLDPTVISGLTALGSGGGAPAADYLFIWDATDSLLKKILPNDLGLAAAAHTIASHSDTNTTGTEVTLLDTAAVGTVVNSKAAIYPASGPSAAGEVLKSSGSSPFTTLVWGTIPSSDTTYTHTWVDSSDDAILRLTAGGSGSGNDDLTIVAGSNITLTPSGDNLTIAATSDFIGCRLSKSAHQTVSGSSGNFITEVTFDGEDFDTDTMHDNSTNNNRITINTAGVYHFGCFLPLQSATDGARKVEIVIGTNIYQASWYATASGSGDNRVSVSGMYNMTTSGNTSYITVRYSYYGTDSNQRVYSGATFWAYRVGSV